jgi:hypothetical protein
MTRPNRFRAPSHVAALLLASVLAACSDGPTGSPPDGRRDPLVEQVIAMGFAPDQIVDRGDHFVVEGDIRLDKKDLARRVGDTPGPGAPTYQRYVSTVDASHRTIRVNLAAVDAENASWASATRAAMNNWSTAPDADIVFVEGTPADLTVSFVDTLSDCTAAEGSWPASGTPGATVRISREYAGDYASAQQVWIMTHELGHNIGLAHTDQGGGSLLPGTPGWDGASVMNSGETHGGCPPVAPTWSAFSEYDLMALRALYPLPSVSGLVLSEVGGNVWLSWNAVPGAVSYAVQRVEERNEDDFYANTVNTTVTEGTWITGITGSPFDTGAAYTGASSCVWSMTWQTSDVSSYFYRVVAHFPRGASPTYPSVQAGDATC